MKSEIKALAVNVADKRISEAMADKSDMWKIIKAVELFVFLFFCSLQDIREKRISVKMLVLFGGLFLASSLLFDEISLEERAYNLLPGMVAFLLAFLTKEQIGYGDAACLAVLGNMISETILFGAVMGGLILLSVCSMILLAGKKANRKTTLPFLPFLTIGIFWQVIRNGV